MAEVLIESDPKSMSPSQYIAMFQEFLVNYEFDQVLEVCNSNSTKTDSTNPTVTNKFFIVSAQDLIHYDPALAFMTLSYEFLMEIFDEALESLVKKTKQQMAISDMSSGRQHIRITDLPPMYDYSKACTSEVLAATVGDIVQFSGTVVRTGSVKMLETRKTYQCQRNQCRHEFHVSADPEQSFLLHQPAQCPSSMQVTTEGMAKCNSTNFREIAKKCVDYQEIKLYDRLQRINTGSLPRSVTVLLMEDLVDRVNPGEDVVVVGTVLRQWRPLFKHARCSIEVVVKANNIWSLNEIKSIYLLKDEKALFDSFWTSYNAAVGREIILRSFCPLIFGLRRAKLAVLLALIGGVHSAERRSNIHVLLVGDPSVGKSVILRFAASLASRSVLTTGVGSSGAGLTCSAYKESNSSDWALDAGALVLADGGVCCIDEFASLRDQDRAAIHEAMEQQRISVAKAGLVVKLDSRCAVIAACNPKSNVPIHADFSAFTGIEAPLLSRFDIVLVLKDKPNKAWDQTVSTHLLKKALGEDYGQGSDEVWTVSILRQYIQYVCNKFNPSLSREALFVLQRYFNMQRQSEDPSNAARSTIRLLESLIRCAEAHARLMCHDVVYVDDAVTAIYIISGSYANVDSLLDKGDSAMEVDPIEWSRHIKTTVFQQLNITEEKLAFLLEQEIRPTQQSHEVRHLSPPGTASSRNKTQSQRTLAIPFNNAVEVVHYSESDIENKRIRLNEPEQEITSQIVPTKAKQSYAWKSNNIFQQMAFDMQTSVDDFEL